MSREMDEDGYKIIKDLTDDVKKVTEKIYGFPSQVNIVSAKLLLGPDGWGGKSYYFMIKYEVDGVGCEELKPVYANLADVVDDVLLSIVSSYERTHIIQ